MKIRRMKLIALCLISMSIMAGCQQNSASTKIDGLEVINISQKNSVHSEPTWFHDGSQLAVEIDGKTISIVNLENGEWENIGMNENSYNKAPLTWYQNELSFIDINYDKEFLIDNSIILWDIRQKKHTKLKEDLPTIYSITRNQYNQIIYTKKAEEFEVILYDLKTEKEEILFRNGHNVQWHPDGKQVGYISDNKIYVYDLTNKNKQLIYSSGEENLIDSLTWSPNGQWIAFSEGNYKTGSGLYVVSPNGESKEQLIEKSNVASLSWSPTGKEIAITTIGSPGSNELFLLEVPEKYR